MMDSTDLLNALGYRKSDKPINNRCNQNVNESKSLRHALEELKKQEENNDDSDDSDL